LSYMFFVSGEKLSIDTKKYKTWNFYPTGPQNALVTYTRNTQKSGSKDIPRWPYQHCEVP
jgi:hypothetical protein